MRDTLRVGLVSIGNAQDVHTWSGVPWNVLRALKKTNVQLEIFSPLN